MAGDADSGSDSHVDDIGYKDLFDDKIKKRVITPGAGPKPEMKADVLCNVAVRVSQDMSAEVLQTYDGAVYRIGEGEAVRALELGLRYMQEGEVADIFGSSNFAWSEDGRPALQGELPIPGGSDVWMLVALRRIYPEEWRSDDMGINEVRWRKESGNDHFLRKEFLLARRCYTAGIEAYMNNGGPEVFEDDCDAELPCLAADCSSNLAATLLDMDMPVEAKDAACTALELRPMHLRALYRAGKACLVMDDFDECQVFVERALAIDSSNAGFQSLSKELRSKKRHYADRSRRIAEQIMSDLACPDELAGPGEENDKPSTALHFAPLLALVAGLIVVVGCLAAIYGPELA